jgi:RNA polymerase sigma-70 factor (ECF subfamily)
MDAPPLNDENDLRPLMFSIAYRMTGSVAEAEDLVQEAFFRMGRARQNGVIVESPKAYLTTTTTRLAINHLRSARVRRESYVGTWLPEPVVADLHDSPEQMAELSGSLSMAFLLLLESLSPVERAVFLLREVFDYPYEEIAQVVGKSEANCRQIFARAPPHWCPASPVTRHRPSKARRCSGRFSPPPARATWSNLSTYWQRTPPSTATEVARRPVRPNRSSGVTVSQPSSSACSNEQREWG